MEHLIFYYGSWIMGLVCLMSMLAVHISNKRVLRDLRHPSEAKDKWTGDFVQEHQKLLRENTKIHNPSVYVIKRMRGRKIGPWTIRQIKGISWGTFILSFLFIGMQILTAPTAKGGMKIPGIGWSLPRMTASAAVGIAMGAVLLILRLILGTGYQEDMVETNLLDYVENGGKEPAKIIPMKSIRKKENPEQESKEREKAAKQMEQGVLEAAAADSRYSHLLNEEEEEIVKDVIKEFLT